MSLVSVMWWLLAALWKPDSFLYHPVRFKLLHSFIGLLSRATCVFHSSVVSPIQVLCIRLASGTCLCCLCWWCCCYCFILFSAETGARSPSPRIPQNWAEPEECGRRRANIGWSEPRLPNSLKPLQVSKCVTITEAQAAAGTHPGFRRDSTQNCFCYWCASVAVGVTLCFQCCRYMRPLKARNPAHNAVVLPHTNKDHTDLQSRHWIHSGGSLSSCEVS